MVEHEIRHLKDLRWTNDDIINVLQNGTNNLNIGIVTDIENILEGLYDAGARELKVRNEIQLVIADRVSKLEKMNHIDCRKKSDIEDYSER
jgi:hypothetical protein